LARAAAVSQSRWWIRRSPSNSIVSLCTLGSSGGNGAGVRTDDAATAADEGASEIAGDGEGRTAALASDDTRIGVDAAEIATTTAPSATAPSRNLDSRRRRRVDVAGEGSTLIAWPPRRPR
jgi:hypothetical protein